ncbi:MAG: hypothetical protein JEZ03_18535 [Bacteroidales bacterium]|nr:hypothetical protein [Bacteroidales bacterium]
MKKYLFYSILLIGFILSSCEKEELQMPININETLSFRGTFKTINSENITETVFLNISNGYYECSTSLPYGHGAGKLDANETTINFIDTLFFPIPALYGPSYVLSGEHYYEFDGKNLKIWREKNIGSIEYNLEILDCKDSHHGILRNLTGLDGCGWIIQLSDSTKLEPINLDDFDIELRENKPVCFQFHERTDLGSYCMVGKVVELDFIE